MKSSFQTLVLAAAFIQSCHGCTPFETLRVVQIVYNYDNKSIKPSGMKLSFGFSQRPGTSPSHQPSYSAQQYKTLFAAKFGRSGETRFDWTHASSWLFEKQLDKSFEWTCRPYKLCTVHQLVGTCDPASVEFRMPWLVRSQKFIPNYRTETGRSGVVPKTCGDGQFGCMSGECISQSYECDNDEDCLDGSDENQAGCNQKWLSLPMEVCSPGSFQCDMGKCIPNNYVCDKEPDCPDGSDEFLPRCLEDTDTRTTAQPNHTCMGQQFNCKQEGKCIPASFKCDGDNDCVDGSDEDPVVCRTKIGAVAAATPPSNPSCAGQGFSCRRGGRCIPASYKCDGDDDCGDGSDEDVFLCSATRRTTLPYDVEDEFWMKGAWISSDFAFEPLMQVGGLDLGNVPTYVCRFISANGGIIPGRLIYESIYAQYTCRYTKGRLEEVVARNETYHVLITSQEPATYTWEKFEKGSGQKNIISVLGVDYELFYICRFEFDFTQNLRYMDTQKIIANGFFKPSVARCLSPFDSRTKQSPDFELLTERE